MTVTRRTLLKTVAAAALTALAQPAFAAPQRNAPFPTLTGATP